MYFINTAFIFALHFFTIKSQASNDTTYKVALSDAIDFDASKLSFFVVLCGLVALTFWLYWFLVLVWKISRTISMRRFYTQMLGVDDACLESLKWSEILDKLRDAQTRFWNLTQWNLSIGFIIA